MDATILLPIVYMITGCIFYYFIPELSLKIRNISSSFLTFLIIPIVIIYNISIHENGIFTIMISIMFIMAIMLYSRLYITKDPIQSLCFCYLNIGWLGLPIALSLYGESSALVMIAAYVGSSIFGNSIGAGLFVSDTRLKTRIIKILKSPPVLSVIIGLSLVPIKDFAQPVLYYPYQIAKVAMGIFGMFILGVWITGAKWLSKDAIFLTLKITLYRFATFSFLISGLVLYGNYYNISLIQDNTKVLYMIGLLPPAANIIVLETHYLKTGKSTPLISIGSVLSLLLILIYGLLTT